MSKTVAKKKECSCGGNCQSGHSHHHHHEDPMEPRPFRVVDIWREVPDTFSMRLVPEDGGPVDFAPGQFNMLYVFGVGEVPISVSGDPANKKELIHTTRAVGKVSAALDAMKPGETIGVRGPLGTAWPVELAEGKDLVFVAGGIGLAPLRPAIYAALNQREKFKNIVIFYGTRTPEDMLFMKEVTKWRARMDMDVHVTVDRATGDWQGRVGVVTKLITGGFDPQNTLAMTCGPEIMMHYAAKTLKERGIPLENIYASMERNMKCGVGLCGHCQWGPFFVCKDGPVFRYDRIIDALNIKEL